ncbi:cupin domain-containing protein [Singulisphaera rosea]
MPSVNRTRLRLETILPAALALALGVGWAARELTFAQEGAAPLRSKTVVLDQIKMAEYRDQGKAVGQLGIYLAGETPRSSKFVTGRLVLDAGKSPHPPHVHEEEEVMVIESGHGEIVCDGETTKVGPGSVMYTTPNVAHGIVNTGDTPLVFTFVKWAEKAKK